MLRRCFTVLVLLSSAMFLAQYSGAAENKAITVLIAGTGSEEYVAKTINDLTDYLRDNGVAIKQVDNLAQSRDASLSQLVTAGGESLLQVNVDISVGSMRDQIVTTCYDRAGKKLWEEKAWGSIVITPERLTNSMKTKLQKHLGKEGLPVAR